MPTFTKQTVAPGQTIGSTWGNNVQDQFRAVVGSDSAEVTRFMALILPTDTRNLFINRTGGLVTSIQEKDSWGTTILTVTFNRTAGVISSVVMTADGATVTYTIVRTGGQITSITKGVV
jgi:hypothetical protein